MTINKTFNGGELVMSLEGRLDTATAPQLESALGDSLGAVNSLVLDLKNLEYISSAGLRVLLSAQKRMSAQGRMSVRNVDETVREIFDLTGFSDILTIEK